MNPEGESRYVDMPGNIVDGQIIFEQEKQKYTDRGMYRGELKDISFEMDMVGMKQNRYQADICLLYTSILSLYKCLKNRNWSKISTGSKH